MNINEFISYDIYTFADKSDFCLRALLLVACVCFVLRVAFAARLPFLASLDCLCLCRLGFWFFVGLIAFLRASKFFDAFLVRPSQVVLCTAEVIGVAGIAPTKEKSSS